MLMSSSHFRLRRPVPIPSMSRRSCALMRLTQPILLVKTFQQCGLVCVGAIYMVILNCRRCSGLYLVAFQVEVRSTTLSELGNLPLDQASPFGVPFYQTPTAGAQGISTFRKHNQRSTSVRRTAWQGHVVPSTLRSVIAGLRRISY